MDSSPLSDTPDTIDFPPYWEATEDGIIYVGGTLTVENLHNAYRQGIFPWPAPDLPMLWHCPDPRGVLNFSDLHVPQSLKRIWKNHNFQITIDQAFAQVISACSRAARPGQAGTWILPEMVEAYMEFHKEGWVHSVEVWDGSILVGGLYGVDSGGVFSGESMFHKQTNASKLALLSLVEHLSSRGVEWIDIQMLTPLFEDLGGKEIPRKEFMLKLDAAHKQRLNLF